MSVHGVIADATWVLALITAGYAYRRVRPVRRDLWIGSAVLFVWLLRRPASAT